MAAPSPILLEACVDSVASAVAAERGGAGRIELCADLAAGGTTPSAGTIAECRKRLAIPIVVMIRPRGGDFLYSDAEVAVMRRDIAHAKAAGVDGVVFGLLRRNGAVDAARARSLLAAARPLDVTFHRAIDAARDAEEALEALIAIGVDRVLTAGGTGSALRGAARIARLVRRAAGRIGIIAGGGIDARNVRGVVERSGVREVHVWRGGTVSRQPGVRLTDARRIARIARALRGR